MSFSHGPIRQVRTDAPDVYAFRITGHIDDDASESLAEYMNEVFDLRGDRGKVKMLLDLTGMTGTDWDVMFDADVIESRFRALKHVSKYVAIGAPDRAARMISIMNKVIPVEAKAFDASEADAAWAFVGARPSSEETAS